MSIAACVLRDLCATRGFPAVKREGPYPKTLLRKYLSPRRGLVILCAFDQRLLALRTPVELRNSRADAGAAAETQAETKVEVGMHLHKG